MKLIINLKKITLLSLGLTAISSVATWTCTPKTTVKTISVANALTMASQVLSGNQLIIAKQLINDLSIGGETIAQDTFYDIINPPAPPKKESAAGPTTAAAGTAADVKNKGEQVTSLQNTWPVPAALQGKVTYIRTDQQGTNECGYRAAFFAKIISEIPLEKISRQTIDTAIKHDRFKKLICQQFIGDEQVVKLAADQDIKNFYVLEYDKINKVPLIMQRTPGSPDDINEILVRLKIKFNERAYFVINTGNHWVLIAIVKPLGLGEKPRVFYLNSLNGPLTENSSAYPQLIAITKGLEL